MADYRRMYYILCDAASRAIDAPPEAVRQILQQALEEAEELYIDTADDEQ